MGYENDMFSVLLYAIFYIKQYPLADTFNHQIKADVYIYKKAH